MFIATEPEVLHSCGGFGQRPEWGSSDHVHILPARRCVKKAGSKEAIEQLSIAYQQHSHSTCMFPTPGYRRVASALRIPMLHKGRHNHMCQPSLLPK